MDSERQFIELMEERRPLYFRSERKFAFALGLKSAQVISSWKARGRVPDKWKPEIARRLEFEWEGFVFTHVSPSEPAVIYNERVPMVVKQLLDLHGIEASESNEPLVKMLSHHVKRLLQEEPGADKLSARGIWTLIEGELDDD